MCAASPAPLFLLAGRPKSMPRVVRPDPLLQQVIQGCGRARPRIAYLGSASHDHRAFFAMLSFWLRNAGAGEVRLAPTVGARLDLAKTRRLIEDADAVLVSGGDADEGMRVLLEKDLVAFLRERFEHGTPFIGLSAGSIMLGRQWVRWPDPDDDSTAELFTCLGFAPLVCDTHGEDEDWEELRTLLRLSPSGTVGHGIPGGAALGVTPDGRLAAMGEAVHRFAVRDGTVARIADLDVAE